MTVLTPEVRLSLAARMAEPHRHHHVQAHVDAMLAGLRELGPLVRAPDVVALAIRFHDAVYDPARTDNEARSAELLMATMAGLAPAEAVDDAAAMVLATRDHAVPPGTRPDLASDMAHLLDLDMAVLGASPESYDAYERGIAAEYVPVHGPEAYARGRRAFLECVLARPRIFLTDRAHATLDAKARENVRRALGAIAD